MSAIRESMVQLMGRIAIAEGLGSLSIGQRTPGWRAILTPRWRRTGSWQKPHELRTAGTKAALSARLGAR